jgi:hypothetical protein
MVILGDKDQLEARFGPFGDSANLTQDRCTVCGECTMGLEIILDTPDGTPRYRGHVESRFGPFANVVSVGAR